MQIFLFYSRTKESLLNSVLFSEMTRQQLMIVSITRRVSRVIFARTNVSSQSMSCRVLVLYGLNTYRCHFTVGDRIIRAACMTRGEIGSAVRAADWTEFISVAVAGSLARRLEAGKSAETSISFFIEFFSPGATL